MWIFMVVFLIPFPCNAKDECPRSVSMSQNGFVNVMFGQRFNITCNFTCLTTSHRVQLLKNEELLSELSLSRDCPASKHTIVLFLIFPAVQHDNSGHYKCQSMPLDVISSIHINVVKPDEQTLKDKYNVTATPLTEMSSEVKSACKAPFSWNAPLWYLLGKTALFLICTLSMVLKKTR
ncbi:hypothetical protein HF521_003312 [Silurus meridionalis]|uniref:Uncharacterized protein n=1 Tax=Silurus meridionalis TaxID=175797 RepID=A0A8T0B2G3_SILME|nr:hypothetical protein HF521_003312 [Silurus meridionalis]